MQDGTPDPAEEGDGHDLLEPLSWRDLAACRGCNPSMFFPERGDSRTVAKALEVCSRCPVTQECLNDNLFEDDGIFGGTSGRQRRKMRSRMGQIRSCRTCDLSFQRKHPGQWYCSVPCRLIAHQRQAGGL
jgi:hypothetical protein